MSAGHSRHFLCLARQAVDRMTMQLRLHLLADEFSKKLRGRQAAIVHQGSKRRRGLPEQCSTQLHHSLQRESSRFPYVASLANLMAALLAADVAAVVHDHDEHPHSVHCAGWEWTYV